MRVLMLATGPFAVPTFRGLLDSRHEVAGLITSPPRVHRGRPAPPPSEIRAIARQHDLPVFDPDDINSPEAIVRLCEFQADLLVVCDYGQILSPAALAAARLGGINLHASLLPKYRGAAPINWAILNGERVSGATVIQMSPRLDAGACILQRAVPIGAEETAVELETRLALLGAGMVLEAIDLLESGGARPIPQNPALATRAPRLKKSDGSIDWSRPAQAIKNHVRAMEPWPKSYTYLPRLNNEPLRLILGPVDVLDADAPPQAAPGEILEAVGGRLLVAAGRGIVAIRAVQPAGKRMMSVEEFLRGHALRPGERFAAAERE
jgi:methionyl-tRNA formyltransferase